MDRTPGNFLRRLFFLDPEWGMEYYQFRGVLFHFLGLKRLLWDLKKTGLKNKLRDKNRF
jgi:hypothetical protein